VTPDEAGWRGQRVRVRGFTLFELLVVVAMLVALRLPAVQSAREAAPSSACANNLRQLALGCTAHLEHHRFFPSGGCGWCWTGDPHRGAGKFQPGSWAYSLLPFFEQTNVFAMAGDSDPFAVSAQ